MDGLTGPIPFHIAKAYGVRAAIDPSRNGKPVSAVGRIDPSVVRPAFPSDQFATRLDAMVSGTVESPIGRDEDRRWMRVQRSELVRRRDAWRLRRRGELSRRA